MFESRRDEFPGSLDNDWSQIAGSLENELQDPRLLERLSRAQFVFNELADRCGKDELLKLLVELDKEIDDYIGSGIVVSGGAYKATGGDRIDSEPEYQDNTTMTLGGFMIVTSSRSGNELCLRGRNGEDYYAVPLTSYIQPESKFSLAYIEATLESLFPKGMEYFDQMSTEDGACVSNILMRLHEIPLEELDELSDIDPRKASQVAAFFGDYVYNTLEIDKNEYFLLSYQGLSMIQGTECKMKAGEYLMKIVDLSPVHLRANEAEKSGRWVSVLSGEINHADLLMTLKDVVTFPRGVTRAVPISITDPATINSGT